MAAIKILVTGSDGQLGSELKSMQSNYPFIEFVFTNRELLALHEKEAIDAYFQKNSFTHCINCAAYTAVDKAEEEPEQAYLINANAVKHLALACSAHNVMLVHISTDYVFNGKGSEPYIETDETDPVNLYGQSKLEGEKLALQHNEYTIVIRTSWLYSSFGKNFVKTMIRLMSEKESIGVVADQFGSPTYAADLAGAILKIISDPPVPLPGIYHYSNSGIINWFQFATAIKEMIQSDCVVKPLHTYQYPTPAKRPAYSAFDTNKIRSQFGIAIPQWEDSLKACIALIRS